jgi:DtxR family Mn-dependent transcriptional regulator
MDCQDVKHLPHECENILVQVWSAHERGDKSLEKLFLAHSHAIPIIEELINDGLLERMDGEIWLTVQGGATARELVRRNRLAEVLLQELLEVRPERVAMNACMWEHVLSAEVTDNICTFLGHPRHCPHGNAIPPGPCCAQISRTVTPLVQPLTTLRVGASARITFITPRVQKRLERLASLGVVPGTYVVLKQKSPAYVIRADQTEIALEEDIARDIFVRETGKSENAR